MPASAALLHYDLSDGSLARQYYESSYITVSFSTFGDLLDLGFVDGVQLVTDFSAFDQGGEGYIQFSRSFLEYLQDETGRLTGQTSISSRPPLLCPSSPRHLTGSSPVRQRGVVHRAYWPTSTEPRASASAIVRGMDVRSGAVVHWTTTDRSRNPCEFRGLRASGWALVCGA